MLHKFNAGYKQRTDLWTKRQGLSEILFGRPNTTDKVAIEMHCNLKAPPGVAPVVLGFFWQNLYCARAENCHFRASSKNYDITLGFIEPDVVKESITLTIRRSF